MAGATESVPVLDAAQQKVVAHKGGPMLVLAGPGTGKTTTIVEAVTARLRESALNLDADPTSSDVPGYSPALVLTFGRAAADELRERIADRVRDGLLPTVSTFHAFSYALVREFSDADAFAVTPRLIDAADQDARLRELLTNSVREGRVPWPTELDAAIGTQGLAEQVRQLLARAQLLGFDDVALRAAAQDADLRTWEALADFLGEYLDVLDASGVLDYSELIHRAVMLLADPGIARTVRQRYGAIYVDEYQDTDPAQVQLLQSFVNPDSTFVAVGDPDQAIYGFRGADVGGILRFRDDFPTATEAPAEIVVLHEIRRFGSNIAQAAGRVIRRVGLGNLPAEVQRQHRTPVCEKPSPGAVEVVTFDSTAAQSAAIADRIRRARLTGEVDAWSDMAIIVRSGVAQLPLLQHALESVGVPTEVTVDDLPLHEHRAVAVLLDLLVVAADPESLTIERTKELLLSEMIGVDGIRYRQLGRMLRNLLAEQTPTTPPTSDHAVRLALISDEFWSVARERVATDVLEPLAELREAIAATSAAIAAGDTAEQILWAAWSATEWSQRLARAARGSGASARSANRDLDSVVALFRAAARADAMFGIARPVQNFLADLRAQSISTTSGGVPQSSTDRDAVALLTAHRAKGLQWQKVFVVGVQEEGWPDLRSRPSLLNPDRLQEDGIGDPPRASDLLESERRLFFVACTRARESLVVTAVVNVGQSPTSGEQPSRFLAELAGDGATVMVNHEPGYQLTSLSMPSVVASLRASLESIHSSADVKRAAAARLARLVDAGIVAADPRRWWGMHEWTDSDREIRPTELPLRVSGSSWSQLDRCSLAWFFEHEVKASSRGNVAAAFGSVVHELADAVTRHEIPAEMEVLNQHLDSVWPSLRFESDWQQAEELAQARAALQRFLNWHLQRTDRHVVGSELRFETDVEVPGDRVHLSGSVDRLEVDDHGRFHIYDLKTQRKPETAAKLATHRQLELYQLVANEGVFDERIEQLAPASALPGTRDASSPAESGKAADASLVLLRVEERNTGLPKVQVQSAVSPQDVKADLAEAVRIVRGEEFLPTSNEFCKFCHFQAVCPIRTVSGEVGQ